VFNFIILPHLFSGTEFIKAIADAPFHKLSSEAKAATAGLINSTARKSGDGFDTVKGNIAHVLMIADMFKRGDIAIHGIEVVDDVLETLSKSVFAGRRVDIVLTQGGRKIHLEVKNYSASTWKANLTGAMRKTPQATIDAAKAEGKNAAKSTRQLYTDIVKYMQNGYSGRQYAFTPDVIYVAKRTSNVKATAIRRDPEKVKEVKEVEDEIIEHMKKKVDDYADELASEFGIRDINREPGLTRWKNMKDDLFDAMEGNGPDKRKFVEIYPFDNIIKKIK